MEHKKLKSEVPALQLKIQLQEELNYTLQKSLIVKDQQISNLTEVNGIKESVIEGKNKEITKYKRETMYLKIGGGVVIASLIVWLICK